MTLIEDTSVLALLEWAVGRTEDRPELHDLHVTLRHARRSLNEPMRVAIVGLIKAGKSTILNALLERDVAATGPVETTFNVNWLKSGLPERCEVVFKSERPRSMLDLGDLASVTDRLGSRQDVMRDVAHIEVFLNLPILETIDLVDTPGLSSVFVDDEQNTRDFLMLHGEEMTEVTNRYSSKADAVLYLFSKGMHESDDEVMKELSKAGNATPINSVGVLTKVDNYFDPREDVKPLDQGMRIASRLRGQASLRQMFYTIVPVCGLLGAGAVTLTDSDWEILSLLATAPEAEVQRMFRSAQRVLDGALLPEVDIKRRASLLRRIGLYGMALAVSLAKSEGSTLETLREGLRITSGVPELLKIIQEHFGGRAVAIKARGVLEQTRSCWRVLRPSLTSYADLLTIGDGVVAEIERLNERELKQSLTEIELLRMIYEGTLLIEGVEAAEVRQALGENGRSCAQRLGCSEDTGLEVLKVTARRKAAEWRVRSQATFMLDRSYEELCSAMTRTYERTFSRIQAAQRLLTM